MTASLRNRVAKMRQRHRTGSSLILAPLIDVLFILIIFLMVSANFDRRRWLEVDLPEATTGKTPPRLTEQQDLVVQIGADGELTLEGREVDLEELETLLAALPSTRKLLPVRLQGDRRAQLGRGLEVLDLLRRLGYGHCVFEVRPPAEAAPAPR